MLINSFRKRSNRSCVLSLGFCVFTVIERWGYFSGLYFRWESGSFSFFVFFLFPAPTIVKSCFVFFTPLHIPRVSTPSSRLNPDLVEGDHYCAIKNKCRSNWCGLVPSHLLCFLGTREMVEFFICPV